MARVLIVEDEPSISMVLQEVLGDEGYHTIAVSDGLEALQWMKDQAAPPDLVLVDLFMPRVSGKDIVMAMRRDWRMRHTPVVLVTGAVPSEHEFPMEGTYQGIISKPFDVADVLHQVRCLLRPSAQEMQ